MSLNLQTWIQLGMFAVAMMVLYFSLTSDSL
jgi:hypothetical protein